MMTCKNGIAIVCELSLRDLEDTNELAIKEELLKKCEVILAIHRNMYCKEEYPIVVIGHVSMNIFISEDNYSAKYGIFTNKNRIVLVHYLTSDSYDVDIHDLKHVLKLFKKMAKIVKREYDVHTLIKMSPTLISEAKFSEDNQFSHTL